MLSSLDPGAPDDRLIDCALRDGRGWAWCVGEYAEELVGSTVPHRPACPPQGRSASVRASRGDWRAAQRRVSCATDVRPTSDGPTKCVPRGDNSRAGQLLRTCLTWTVCAALHDLSLGRRSRSVHGENVRAAPPSPASRGSSHETPSYGHSHPWVQQSLLAFAHIDAQRSGHRRVGDAARQPIELNAGVIEQN